VVEVEGTQPAPRGLLEAFWAYDRALLAGDTETMAALFAPGSETLRGDGRKVLVGHDRITAFRVARTQVPTRRVIRLHVRVPAASVAVVVAETVAPDGLRPGLQTQVWCAVDGRWQVTAAHVTAPAVAPSALDRTTWRVVGDPLVRGAAYGPLRGLTVAIKDLYAVRGQPVGAGNPTWLDESPPAHDHAAAVTTLLDSGADIVGIARTDEFAYSIAGTNAHYGTPPNPAAPDRIPGGSSNGPASAVATGEVDLGLGTDTGGSVRVPAAYQGLLGLRTTHGLLDRTGMLPLAPSFDTVGWLTRDAGTLARVADAALPTVDDTGPALARGLVVSALLDDLDEPVRAEFARAVTRLVEHGVLTELLTDGTVDGPTLDTWSEAFRAVQGHEAWALHGPWVSAHPGALGPDVAARFATAATVDDKSATRARRVVQDAGGVLHRLLTSGTALLLPTTAGPAPPRTAGPGGRVIEAERARTLKMTCLAALAGVPGVSMPLAHFGGLPLGITALAAPGADRRLVELAARATGERLLGRGAQQRGQ